MTEAQKVFCNTYLRTLNATASYKTAYPTCKKDGTARTNGCKLLTNTNIQDYLETQMRIREERTHITQDMVLNELSKIAFVCLEESDSSKQGKNKVKLVEKIKALELIGKHLGMFKEKVELNQDKPFEVVITVKGK